MQVSLTTALTVFILLLANSPAAAADSVPELNALIRSIHQQFLQLKATNSFFAAYSSSNLSEMDGVAVIRYSPPEKESSGPAPQQPSHVTISYVPLERNVTNQTKYWNSFEDFAPCRFPELHQKLYGEVLIWEDRNLEREIERLVVRECKRRNAAGK